MSDATRPRTHRHHPGNAPLPAWKTDPMSALKPLTRRRLLTACLAGAGGAALLAACSRAPGDGPSSTPDARSQRLSSLAAGLVEDMAAGDFASTIALADAAVSASLDEAGLQSAWEQAVAGKGSYRSIAGTAAEPMGGSVVVIVVADFDSGRVTAQISFDEEDRINGLYLRDATQADLARIAAGAAASTTPPSTGEHSIDHVVQVGGHQLTGLLVTPATGIEARDIVVLLVAGSGPQDMDETIGAAANKPLRDLADGLAARGISSLRYHKRYYQDPGADDGQWTLGTEVLDDVASAIALLRSSSHVAGYRIVVAGHSLGGMLLPRILASDPGLAAGVALAGSPRSLFDIIADQRAAQISASGVSQEEQDAELAAMRAQVEAAKAITDPQAEPVMDMPASYIASLNEMHQGLATDIAAVDVPWLILQGAEDAQVDPAVDYPAWQEALAGKDAQFQLFDGLNHLFMPTAGAGGPLDYDTPNTLAAEVPEAIAVWMDDHLA